MSLHDMHTAWHGGMAAIVLALFYVCNPLLSMIHAVWLCADHST